MKIELRADCFVGNPPKVVQLVGKVVDVKEVMQKHYKFDYQGKEIQIQKKFAVVVAWLGKYEYFVGESNTEQNFVTTIGQSNMLLNIKLWDSWECQLKFQENF